MNKSVIIHAKAGHVPPKEYVAKVAREFPSCYGIILQDTVDGKEILDTVSDNKALTVDEAMSLFENMKDQPCWFQFGNMVQDFDKETDIPPFLFQQSGDGSEEQAETILGIMFEGDFSTYSKPGEGHTEEYRLYDEFVFPALQEKFAAAASLDDFFQRLVTSQFQQMISHTMSHRGVALFVPITGEPLLVARNELGKEYDWGWTSNSLAWEPKSDAPSRLEKTISAAKTRLQRITGGQPLVEKAEPAPVTTGKKKVKPPAGLQGNARNTWIRLFMNLSKDAELPKNKDATDFTVEVDDMLVQYAERPLTTRDEVRSLEIEVKQKHFPSSTVNEQMAAANKAIDKPKPTITAPADYLPVLDADTKEGSVTLIQDWATRPREKAPTPLDIQRIESKYIPLSQQMGITVDEYGWWTMHDMKKLGKTYPDTLALACDELRNMCWAAGLLNKPAAAADKQVEVPSPKPAVTPAPAQQPLPAAAKKNSRLERALKRA